MRRLGLLAALVLVGAAFVWADEDAEISAEERARSLRHDLELIRQLVKSGLVLSEQKDPLERAKSCNQLAGRLSEEIKQAAVQKDGLRAADMGQHLQALLERGVASNLNLVRRKLTAGSPLLVELEEVAHQTVLVVKSAQQELERLPQGEQAMERALRAVAKGRDEVEKAVKGSARVPEDPGAGKRPGIHK
jgi:hypothetical protein